MAKPIFKSTTLWANLGFFVVIVLDELLTQGVLPEKFAVYALILMNVILRLKTKESVKLR